MTNGQAFETTRVSVASLVEQEGNGNSGLISISADDGRYVAFYSEASNLVAGDTNGVWDAFVCDRVTKEITRVSIDSTGAQGNGPSSPPENNPTAISADGRYVAFYSEASNLVAGDTNGKGDAFVHDRDTGKTTRISVDSSGKQGNRDSVPTAISADGRYVAFRSSASNLVAGDTNGMIDAFVHDRETETTARVSVDSSGKQGNGISIPRAISADGRYVAFRSEASNLVAGDTNDRSDAFVRDRKESTTTRVSVSSSGGQGNFESYPLGISADGRYVSFWSTATNLVAGDTNDWADVFVHDRETGKTTRVSVDSSGEQGNGPSDSNKISADGRYVTFVSSASNLVAGDTNGAADAFVHDRDTGKTTRVSVTSSEVQGNFESLPRAISADGRYVVFESFASNLVPGDTNGKMDVFVRDRMGGKTTRVNINLFEAQGNGKSIPRAISADGRYVTFSSKASSLVPRDTNNNMDAFVHDRVTRTTTRVSLASTGAQGNNWSDPTAISADGQYVAFMSLASNFVPGDTNLEPDAFVRDRINGTTTRISVASSGAQGNGKSTPTAISADGRYVTFASAANNLVAGDTNGVDDAFIHDRKANTTIRVSLATAGAQGNDWSYPAAISADGRYVAFNSAADNFVSADTNGATDAFIRDRKEGKTTRVSVNSLEGQGNDDSFVYAVSADGRYVAFASAADNLVAGDTNLSDDAFIRDRVNGTTTRVSVDSSGVQGNGHSYPTAISADGRYVTLVSTADNLVAGDTNGVDDVFVHDRETGKTTRVSVASLGTQANKGSFPTAVSADGRYIAFTSSASNLVAGDTNGVDDAFIHDRILDKKIIANVQTTLVSKPQSAVVGQTVSYIFKAKNNSLLAANNVVLTNVSLSGSIVDITTSQGKCSIAAISVCNIGTLPPGSWGTVTVKIKASASTIKQLSNTNAKPFDNKPLDNTVVTH